MKTLNLPLLLSLLLASSLTAWAQDPSLTDDDDLGEDTEEVDLEFEENQLSGLSGAARRKVVQEILKRGSQDDFTELALILKQDHEDLDTQHAALRILMGFGGKPLVEIGRKLLTQGIPYKQAMGARLLGASKEKSAVPALLQAAKGVNSEVRFWMTSSLAQLADKRAVPQLSAWTRETPSPSRTAVPQTPGIQVRLAYLALCLVGESRHLATVLDQCDRQLIARGLAAHDLDVMWQHWSPRVRISKVKEYQKMAEYVRLFERLLERMTPVQMKAIVSFVGERPGSEIVDMLYTRLDSLITRETAANGLVLLDLPAPELQEEAARALADFEDAELLARLRSHLRSRLTADSWLARAFVMRVSDLFPQEERAEVLRAGLSDRSAFVVEEALRAAGHGVRAQLSAELAALEEAPRWADNGRIRSQLMRASLSGTGSSH